MEENRIFPDNWKEVVRGKKVILYNTGVSSLLGGREKRIEKMKWVFQTFKEHPEVVLWWRPHPLELSTLQSMLPELEEQYMAVKQQYIEENIGVLDESVDLNRAIAISDAYYGAWSSVAELYKAAGTPVLYENNYIKEKGRIPTAFVPAAICVKSETIWFIQHNSNKLIGINRETSAVEKIINISCEPPFCNRLYYWIIDIGSGFLLLFGDSGNIYEYEIERDIIKIHKPQKGNFVFSGEAVIEKNSKLLLFPYGGSDIQEYDYKLNTFDKKRFCENKIKIAKCFEMVGSNVYMVGKESNTLYQYNLTKGGTAIVHIGEKDNKYWGVRRAGSYYVLPHIDKEVVTLWNEETGEVIELTEFPEKYTCMKGWAYFDMFERAGKLYVFPAYANMILKIDIETRTITQVFSNVFIHADYNTGSELYSGQIYIYAEKKQQYVYAYSLYKKCWQIFDLDTMEMKEESLFEIREEEHKILLETLLDCNTYSKTFCEWEREEICTLENYIKNLASNYPENNSKKTQADSIGSKIYKMLMNEL